MKKTSASKSRSKTAASRKTSHTATRQKMSLVESYYRQTDEFFLAHPNSRVLIGLFIVVFSVFVGLLFHDRAQVMGWGTPYYPY